MVVLQAVSISHSAERDGGHLSFFSVAAVMYPGNSDLRTGLLCSVVGYIP